MWSLSMSKLISEDGHTPAVKSVSLLNTSVISTPVLTEMSSLENVAPSSRNSSKTRCGVPAANAAANVKEESTQDAKKKTGLAGLLGNLFGSTTDDKNNNEVIIFITPKIVDNSVNIDNL